MWGVAAFFFTLLVFWFSKIYGAVYVKKQNPSSSAPHFHLLYSSLLPMCCACSGWLKWIELLLRICASLLDRRLQCSLTCCLQESTVVLLIPRLCRLSFLPVGILSSHQEPAFGVFFKGNNNYKSSKLCLMWTSPFIFLSSPAMVVRMY